MCQVRSEDASTGPRLLTRVRTALRVRHYSRRTEKAYVGWIKRFIFFHGIRHPATMGEPEVRTFLDDLAIRHRVSASTQNQAFSALLFLYRGVLGQSVDGLRDGVRAKTPDHLPVVLTIEEVRAVLSHLRGTPWLMASLIYGSGLRVLECARLRVKDLDFSRGEVTVRDGKGRKDRVTLLPVRLQDPCAATSNASVVSTLPIWTRARAASRCPRRSRGSTRTPTPNGPGSGSFPRPGPITTSGSPSASAITSTRPSCSGRSTRPCVLPGSPSMRPVIRCGTRLRPISWRLDTTSGPSRNCSATRTSAAR